MKVSDLQKNEPPPNILLYGEVGCGKTILALTLGEHAQVIDVDLGLRSGYSLKDEFTDAIYATAKGEKFFCGKVLDVLVNNAAIQLNKPMPETTNEEWERVQATNVQAIFAGSKLAHPLLREAGGAIGNGSSVHALATSVNVAAYAASKGSVLALTRAMALEFAAGGVRVNAVMPGAIDTEMLRAGLDRSHHSGDSLEAKLKALGARIALGRVGRPEEIARTILFLADSEQSSYITGAALVVDGGALARLSTE